MQTLSAAASTSTNTSQEGGRTPPPSYAQVVREDIREDLAAEWEVLVSDIDAACAEFRDWKIVGNGVGWRAR